MIRDKVMFGVRDERIKERLLREADLTLNKALDVCRAADTSKQQIEAMGVTQTQALFLVHTMQARKKGGHHSNAIRMPKQSSNDKREYTNTSACKYCGKSHAPRQCAAYGKLCRKCGGPNHVASVCLRGVVWHAALPLVDLCILSRVAIPVGYSSVQYMSVKSIAVGGTLTCL